MSCACEFEAKIQVQCALEVVSIIRSGEALEKKSDLLKHSGCIVGCLGAYTDTSDAPVPFGQLPEDLESCCNEVEALCTGEGAQANPILVAVLMKLVQLILSKYL